MNYKGFANIRALQTTEMAVFKGTQMVHDQFNTRPPSQPPIPQSSLPLLKQNKKRKIMKEWIQFRLFTLLLEKFKDHKTSNIHFYQINTDS